jgi:hypothetical protein
MPSIGETFAACQDGQSCFVPGCRNRHMPSGYSTLVRSLIRLRIVKKQARVTEWLQPCRDYQRLPLLPDSIRKGSTTVNEEISTRQSPEPTDQNPSGDSPLCKRLAAAPAGNASDFGERSGTRFPIAPRSTHQAQTAKARPVRLVLYFSSWQRAGTNLALHMDHYPQPLGHWLPFERIHLI